MKTLTKALLIGATSLALISSEVFSEEKHQPLDGSEFTVPKQLLKNEKCADKITLYLFGYPKVIYENIYNFGILDSLNIRFWDKEGNKHLYSGTYHYEKCREK